MFPIKITENCYVNPTVVARVEFDPPGTFGNEAYFTLLFENMDIEPVQLRGPEAEQAMRNWTAAYERNTKGSAVLASE